MRLGFLVCLLGCTAWVCACVQNPCPLPGTPGVGQLMVGQVLDLQGAPVEAAWVVPADATGAPISGMMRARTDAAGRFWTAQVPPGFAYVLLARLPAPGDSIYSGLAVPALAPDVNWEVSAASTVVTMLILQGRAGMPGVFDRSAYQQAVDAVKDWLKQRPQPVLSDLSSLKAWMEARQQEDPALGGWMRQLSQETARAGSREQVEAAVAEPRVGPLDAFRPIY